jgi:hypothetical protein
MSARRNYWVECLQGAFDEHGIVATDEQIKLVAADVEGSHENIGMAFHQPESPYLSEIKKLKADLEVERRKIGCLTCRNTGQEVINFGAMQSISRCPKCRGEGKHLP